MPSIEGLRQFTQDGPSRDRVNRVILAASKNRMTKPLNIAHRGGAGLWPENTLFAFVQAAKTGCDGAELDVQLTRDGKLAVFHDFRLSPALCRKPGGSWVRRGLLLIRELAFDGLTQFDVGRARPGSLYARRHRKVEPQDGARVPLLGDVIRAVQAVKNDFRLFIEIKTSPEDRSLSAPPEAVAEAVIACLRAEHFLKHSVLVGFDWPALLHAKRLEPGLACWFTTMRRRRLRRAPEAWAGGFDPYKFGGSIPKAVRAAGGDGWFPSRTQATPRAIAEAKALGLRTGVWTVNGAREMRAFAKLGLDAVCTDRPDIFRAALG
jgi:glycerophosphoryl diester phosphodiesterase